MAQTTLGFGIGMILLGVVSYLGTGRESTTALIPAFFGIAFTVLGLVMRDDSKAKHAGHFAALLAVLGLLGSARGVPEFFELVSGGGVERPAAAVAQTLMALACAVFIALGVKSFRDARKAREQA